MKNIKDLIDLLIGEFNDWRHNFREIGYAIVIVLLINTFLVQNYQIPTGSMIPNLMPGDRLFANRFMFGVKVPFTDGLIGWRLPKIKEPEVDDLIVFRAPSSTYNACERTAPYHVPSTLVQILKLPVYIFALSPFDWDPRILFADKLGDILTGGKQMTGIPSIIGLKTVDLDPRKEYVKRIIAKSGDTIEIREQKLYMNGNYIEDKYGYFKYGDRQLIAPSTAGGEPIDFYGPVYIPKKGDVMVFKKYVDTIDYRDRSGFDVFINDKPANYDVKLWYWINIYEVYAKDNSDEFIFNIEEDYYFCLGDNRDESCDSRMWGLVPYHLIKGQPNIVWMQAKRDAKLDKGFWHYFFIK